jgi:hypothetical protein
MARLTDLTRTLSHSTGVTQTSLSVIARVLREAGLVATGTRGPGANMGPRDLATLLLAIGVQGPHLKAADIVKEVGAQKLASAPHINATPFDYIGDDPASLGLHLGQDLIQTLSDIIERYAVPTPMTSTLYRTRLSSAPSPESALGGADWAATALQGLTEEIVLPEEDRAPSSVKVSITRRDKFYFPSITVGDANGRVSLISFSQPEEIEAASTQDIGMEVTVTIHPWVAHDAICCIRDLDIYEHPFCRPRGR